MTTKNTEFSAKHATRITGKASSHGTESPSRTTAATCTRHVEYAAGASIWRIALCSTGDQTEHSSAVRPPPLRDQGGKMHSCLARYVLTSTLVNVEIKSQLVVAFP